jgi:anti-anti-sigma regulatory factor
MKGIGRKHTHPLHLLSFLQASCPECLLHARERNGKLITIAVLPSEAEQKTVWQAFHEWVESHRREGVMIIDLDGISLMTPSIIRLVIDEVTVHTPRAKTQVLFVGVEEEVYEGFHNMHMYQKAPFPVWAVNNKLEKQIIGCLPNSLRDLLKVLSEEEAISAREIAEQVGENRSKRAINRICVGLQELYTMGLVIREKVNGSQRRQGDGSRRGWTYYYQPTYCVLSTRGGCK